LHDLRRQENGMTQRSRKPARARRPGDYPPADPEKATGISNRRVGVERAQQEELRPGRRRDERIHGPAGDLAEQVKRRTGGRARKRAARRRRE
jgi:hypothetical protein